MTRLLVQVAIKKKFNFAEADCPSGEHQLLQSQTNAKQDQFSYSSDCISAIQTQNHENEGEKNQVLGSCVKVSSGHQHMGRNTLRQESESSQSHHSLHSIDVNLPPDTTGKVVTQHLTRNMVRAMVAVNMLQLCASSVYRTEMCSKLAHGVPRGGRDAYDAAGKFVLTMKLLSLGVKESQI